MLYFNHFVHFIHSSSDTPMLKIQQYTKARLMAFTLSLDLDPTFGNLPLLTVFLHKLIAMPSFCYSHVCVCFHIMPYANCLGWTVLYVHVKYGIYVNMHDVSTQGVDERMINVHYHYVHFYYYISGNAEKAQPKTKNMLFEGNSLSISLYQYSPCYFYVEYYSCYTSTTIFTAITKLMFQILRKR